MDKPVYGLYAYTMSAKFKASVNVHQIGTRSFGGIRQWHFLINTNAAAAN